MTVNLTGEFSKDFVPKQNGRFPAGQQSLYRMRLRWKYDYDYDLLQVHVVIPLATCLRNGSAIPLGYAEFSV